MALHFTPLRSHIREEPADSPLPNRLLLVPRRGPVFRLGVVGMAESRLKGGVGLKARFDPGGVEGVVGADAKF